MFEQALPAVSVGILACINAMIKRGFFNVSSFIFLYVEASLMGSLLLVHHPRTGYSFVDIGAMIYLSVGYVMLMLPLLFYRDGKCYRQFFRLSVLDNAYLNKVGSVLATFTVTSLIYFLITSIPMLLFFLKSGMDRASYRAMVAATPKGLLFGLMNQLNVFCLCCFFLAIVLLEQKSQRCRFLPALLVAGGMSNVVCALRMVARSAIFEMCLFGLSAVLSLWMFLGEGTRKRLLKYWSLLILISAIPFLAITLARFTSDTGVGSDDGIVYDIVSYFCTGPYSFNVDYVAHVEESLPTCGGWLTNGLFVFIKDKIFGTNDYEIGAEFVENELMDPVGSRTYRDISGAYSGEFRTLFGAFLVDFSPLVALIIVAVLACVVCVVMRNSVYSLGTCFFVSLYFLIVLFSPIGYAFSERHRNIILVASLSVGFLLRSVKVVTFKKNE